MDKENAWNKIPLEDYEQHMQHATVAQSQLLNALTKKYLQKHTPERALFLGVSGGNGLEHIDVNKTKSVYGIDINKSYIEETQKRFGAKIKQLVLVNTDISISNESFLKADFVWAALIFEYMAIQKGFEFIANNIATSAKLIITIQANNGSSSVSQTKVESVKSLKEIFKIVDKNDLQIHALKFGFELHGEEENILPNGKSLLTYAYIKTKAAGSVHKSET
ncbi:class I SAM-dependent methyltransferase [Filimonas effusa]|uniref:Class I SAM-dependent methyltransferase n=1 Tax=Filimonas effusa TaxID=2508721 RepID=A0A4Q1D9M7_9BACT|nr:class I SAM-dependent methyltransferase [Filimonas effusa]RXK86092.1 class I SAM-dependent methyltransferase [Filimonas effusa]